MSQYRSLIQSLIQQNRILIFSKTFCGYCTRVKSLLDSLPVAYHSLELDTIPHGAEIQQDLCTLTGQTTVPNVFIEGKHIGGCEQVTRLHTSGVLMGLIAGTSQPQEKTSKPELLINMDTETSENVSPSGSGWSMTNTHPSVSAHCGSTGTETKAHSYDYDLAVIGGGSGGLSCVREASKFGKKVILLDHVKPSPLGTVWGLGGTCVNVGCIPKKLFHQAGLVGDTLKDAWFYGWEVAVKGKQEEYITAIENLKIKNLPKMDESKNPSMETSPMTVPDGITEFIPESSPALTNAYKHNWDRLRDHIQEYISSLNWGYRVLLQTNGIEYRNALAEFVDPHTIRTTMYDRSGVNVRSSSSFTADKILIATGGRPRYLDIPNAKELCVTSDDIFSLAYPPGKTLVIGGSYVALECAGFLSKFQYPTTIMARSIFLRGFDQQMAEMVVGYMKDHGVHVIRKAVPVSLEAIYLEEAEALQQGSCGGLTENGRRRRIKVTWKKALDPDHMNRIEQNAREHASSTPAPQITHGHADYALEARVAIYESEIFDTVLIAIGRDPLTKEMGLDRVGVRLDPASQKILTDEKEQTNVPHIYAIGDILYGKPELTPVAIHSGTFLARRLFSNSQELTHYDKVPTTVFTPLEYGAIGLGEEEAIAKYGADQIQVYHSYFRPYEWGISHRENNACYCKLITLKSDNERVIGLHIVSPNAGEIIQGYAVSFRMGATRADFEATICIHPTVSEEILRLKITKASGEDPMVTGCCG